MMNRVLPAISVILLSVGTIQAAEPPARALLFSEAEVAAVEAARADFRRAAAGLPASVTAPQSDPAKPAGPPNIYVSAIIDLGDGQWTVWANGLRIDRQHQAKDFQVVAVSRDAVDIRLAGPEAQQIRLHPFQTWRSQQHDVVEGIVP